MLMDRKRFLSFATAVACIAVLGSVAPVQVNAQNPDPYANTVSSEDFGSFDPTTSFSVQADMSTGQTFYWQGSNGYSFSYTAPRMAMYSFLVDFDNLVVTVYESSTELDVLDLEPISYVDSINVTNNPDLILQQMNGMTGIYESSNLFSNPGFEEYATYTTGDETTLSSSNTRGTPVDWDYDTSNGWRLQNTRYQGDTYEGMFDLMEGNSAFMMHNSTGLLSQQLSGLTAGQWYKVNWRQFSHSDTSPVTLYYAYILKGSAEVASDGSNVIAMHSYYSGPVGMGYYVDPLFAFRIPEGEDDGTYYFAVGKLSGNTINHFDMMTLVAVDESVLNLTPYISFDGDEVTWEEGLTVPVGGGEVIYEDVTTQYMVNPSFEDNVDQQVNVSPYNPDASISTASGSNNGGINQPYGWTIAYSTGIQAGDVWDQASVNNGTSPNGSSNGLTATDGEYFFYYRSRWYDDQDLTISQTTAELPVGYYNITFDACLPEGQTPVTVSVGDYTTEVTNVGSFQTYTFRVNLAVPQSLLISAASFKDGSANSTAASMALDNFRIIYCGEADEESARESLIDQVQSYYARLAAYDPSMYPNNVPAGVEVDWYIADDAFWDLDDVETATLEELQNLVILQRTAYNNAVSGVDILAELKETLTNCQTFLSYNLPGLADYQEIYNTAQAASTATAGSSDDEEAALITNDYCDSLTNLLISASRDYVLSGVTNATSTQPFVITDYDLYQQVVSAPQFTSVGGDTSNSSDRVSTGWSTNNVASSGDFRLNTTEWVRAEGDTVRTNCWNNWSNSFTSMELYQEITNLPEGMYSVTAKETDNQTVWYDQHVFVSSIAGESAGLTPTTDISERGFGEYTQMPATDSIWVPEGGTLRIGMKSTSGGDVLGWFCVTDFELYYYPAAEGEGSNAVLARAEEIEALAEAHYTETMGAEKDYISSVVAEAYLITEESSTEEITAALTALQTCEDTIEYCVTAYAEFEAAVEAAQEELEGDYRTESGAEAYSAVISDVLTRYQEAYLPGSGRDITYLDSLIAELETASDEFVYTYQMEQVTDIENSGALLGASEANPVDLTDFIVNPTCDNESNYSNPEGWTYAGTVSDHYTASGEHYSGESTDTYLDDWNSTYGALQSRICQTIYVPNGQYILKCAARTNGEGFYIYANGDTVQVKNEGNTGGGIWEDAEEGSAIKEANSGQGYGWSYYEVRFGVYSNVLDFGVTTVCGYEDATAFNGTWFSADDFQLLLIEKGWSVGIEEVGADATSAADFKVYTQNGYIIVEGVDNYTVYSISGMQVDAARQLPAGTYIVTANGKSVKVAVQ